jgi:tetratricopeptide (TPR) repeat protein
MPERRTKAESPTRAVLRTGVAAVCATSLAASPVIAEDPAVRVPVARAAAKAASPQPAGKASERPKPVAKAAPKRVQPAEPRFATEIAPPVGEPLVVRVGENAEFSRVEFAGPAAGRATARREGAEVVVRVPGARQPDISRLRVGPPRWLNTADLRPFGGGIDVVLKIDAGADVRIGRDGGALYVNLFQAAAPAEPEPGAETDARPNPVPKGGVVKVEAEAAEDRLTLRFPFAAPLGAAAFRRGDSIWIVFDAKAQLDIAGAPKALGPVKRMRWASGPDFTALRVVAPEDTTAALTNVGGVWSVAFGRALASGAAPIAIARDDETGPPALTAAMAGSTKVVWLTDPAVGDRIGIVTALGPAKALQRGRELVDASLLPTFQGLAVKAVASDLRVTADGDLVRIHRPRGMTLSSPAAGARRVNAPVALPQPAALPAVVDFDSWPKTGEGGFRARYAELMALAAEEAGKGKDAPVSARMGLARFLVGSELAYEAIGVLNQLVKDKPAMAGDAEFRGLRGAARAMVGRWAEAQADFSASAVAADPSSALWRGYIDARQGAWTEARQAFAQGASALNLFPPRWKARFGAANARAALELGDMKAAETLLTASLNEKVPPLDQLALRLIQAEMFEKSGDKARALKIYDAVSRASLGSLATPAELKAIKLRLENGSINPVEAVRRLDSLKFRWRGDATELEIIRTAGQIYLEQGRYREGLEALRSAGQRLPNLPQAAQLQADLAAAFRSLFLEGLADGLQPIQALGLFYDFRELTPVGADGDEMVRRLARRLVDVDLLGQASELLKYQVDNRLDGVAKAQVATDLALIYLMDRKPEDALQAIWSSRTTLLPTVLNSERRVIEARALSDLGRQDHALEVLARDPSGEANDVRAEIYWRQKDWANAGQALERRLEGRWSSPLPLSGEEETRLLRAAIAYSLAGDDASLMRLNSRFSPYVDEARAPDALRVALSGLDSGVASPADFARLASQADAFSGWVARMKQKLRDRPKLASAPAASKAA